MASITATAMKPDTAGGGGAVVADAVSLEFQPRRRGEQPVEVLRDCSMTCSPGEFVALIGPSGCGKSSMLNLVSGLLMPTAGRLTVDGEVVSGIHPKIGYMFQQDTLLPWDTVIENVRLPLDARGEPDIDGRCDELLEKVHLREFRDRYPAELSGGMRQRVQLARVLAQDPEILLMDEPFGSLDAQTKLLLQDEFLRLWEQSQRTVLFVTHDLAEAIRLADRILLFTHRPAAVKAIYDVGLPRPRRLETLVRDDAYNDLFARIWADLRQEISDDPTLEQTS